jgi:hypothetical protein
LGRAVKTIAKSATLSLLLYCLGCGSGLTKQVTTQDPLAVPSIAEVLPQTITAGSQTTTLKITGTNFPSQAVILWNGGALATTVVDANTLSSTIGSSQLITPTTVQLQVRNPQTMQESQAVPVKIAAASTTNTSSPLAISTATLPQGVVSAPYTAALTAAAGTTPYTWSITSGSLPAGLSLMASSGVISGTPTLSGNYSFGVTAMDSSSPAQSATATFGLSVAAAPSTATSAPLTINSSAIVSGTIGSGYSTRLQAGGGTAPYTWSITSGSLPAGLSLASSTGLISGTPISTGTAAFTASVTDSASPAQTTSAALSLLVSPSALVISSASTLPSGTAKSTYSTLLHATGGTRPYTWSVTSGSLPAGLSLASDTGVISGTPTLGGNFSFGVTVVDSGSPAQSATSSLSLTLQSVNTFTNLQSATGWKSSGQLAPRYDDWTDTNSCSGVTWSMSQGVTAPSLSGNAAAFNLGGTTPYSDVLFYNQLIGDFSTQGLPDSNHTLVPSLNNFTYDLYFYLTDAAHTQAMEFDINWFMNSVGITWGTECRISGGNEWDIWDNVGAKWVPTGFACNPLPNAWNHVTVTAQRGPNNTVVYQTITLNGITSNINKTYAPFLVPSNWYGITVNYQMDGDVHQTAITSYADKFSFTYW